MTYDEVLTHFQVKKRQQDKAQCQCPAHDDRQASLTVTKGRDSVLIHCHAGCDIDNVLSAAGLKKSDLFYQEKRTGSSWQAKKCVSRHSGHPKRRLLKNTNIRHIGRVPEQIGRTPGQAAAVSGLSEAIKKYAEKIPKEYALLPCCPLQNLEKIGIV